MSDLRADLMRLLGIKEDDTLGSYASRPFEALGEGMAAIEPPWYVDGKRVNQMGVSKRPYVAPAVRAGAPGSAGPRMPWETPRTQQNNAGIQSVMEDALMDEGATKVVGDPRGTPYVPPIAARGAVTDMGRIPPTEEVWGDVFASPKEFGFAMSSRAARPRNYPGDWFPDSPRRSDSGKLLDAQRREVEAYQSNAAKGYEDAKSVGLRYPSGDPLTRASDAQFWKETDALSDLGRAQQTGISPPDRAALAELMKKLGL